MLSTIKSLRWIFLIILLLTASQVFGHGMSESEKQTIIEGGNLGYIWIGAVHMLSGYDHLAFVFGIIFFLTRFKDIVKYITAFTLGHSITLIYATFSSVQVNYFLIDAIIALSVCYIAFVNLGGFRKLLNIDPPNMLVMIGILGLIHGLGLSTRLQQLPLSEDNLLMNIISFNLGIEVGQITALGLMLIVISLFRKSDAFPAFSRIINSLLFIAGIILFLMQMHGFIYSTDVEESHVLTKPEVAQEAAIQHQPDGWKDTVVINIPARSGKEYKLQVLKGATFEYEWTTNNKALYFDFHGEPKGDTTGYFKTFKKNIDVQSNGSLTTIFEGTHGWYWKNDNAEPVTITLKVRGDYQRLD